MTGGGAFTAAAAITIIKTDLHTVPKNVTTLSCYNFDVHESILIIFGRNVTEKVSNNALFSRLI